MTPAQPCARVAERQSPRKKRAIRQNIKATEIDLAHALRRLQPHGWPYPSKPPFGELHAEANRARERLAELNRELWTR